MASAVSAFALKDRQRAVFEAALSAARVWQVLVSDARAHDALAPLLQPADLRRYGVTLHARIDAPRGPVPDVPALYVMAPDPENIAWLLRDVDGPKALYDRASVCFTSAVSRPMLAALAAQLKIPAPVTRVCDLYSNFVSLEQNLFSLNMPQSYVAINSVGNESALAALIEPIVSGIFSVLVTLGVVPIIRAQCGGPAEAVATALDDALRENLQLFQSGSRAGSFRRPLLLLLDRDFDFNAMLHHTWTYQALVHDCLNMHLNKVSVQVSSGSDDAPAMPQTYWLDKRNDAFWEANSSVPFPSVAENIETALTQYRGDVEEINRKAGGDGVSAGTTHLANAISTLPELSRRKENIDIHTNIATALLECINKRALDTFFELEGQIMGSAHQPATVISAADYKAPVMELLRGQTETSSGEKRGAGSPTDRLRLFIVYYAVFGAQLSEKDMAEFRAVLVNAGADTTVLEHIRKLRGYRHDSVSSTPAAASGVGSRRAQVRGLMTSVMNRGYRGLTSAAQNARKLITEQRRTFAVARILELFMSEQARAAYGASANSVLDGYMLFDPKLAPEFVRQRPAVPGLDAMGENSQQRRAKRMLFSDAIVFTVGGGNYVEYNNCLETVQDPKGTEKGSRNVLYGTTELMTAEGFLEQLATVSKVSARKA